MLWLLLVLSEFLVCVSFGFSCMVCGVVTVRNFWVSSVGMQEIPGRGWSWYMLIALAASPHLGVKKKRGEWLYAPSE